MFFLCVCGFNPGTSSQKSNNVRCSCNLDERGRWFLSVQPYNKLAAGPGCNPSFTPRHLRLDPSSPHPSAVKENRGFFSARSRSKQKQWGNSKSQSGGWVQTVILRLLSFASANIFRHQIKVKNGMRRRGCGGCMLLLRWESLKVAVWSRRENEKKKSAVGDRPFSHGLWDVLLGLPQVSQTCSRCKWRPGR